jgi:hypothetical protein
MGLPLPEASGRDPINPETRVKLSYNFVVSFSKEFTKSADFGFETVSAPQRTFS